MLRRIYSYLINLHQVTNPYVRIMYYKYMLNLKHDKQAFYYTECNITRDATLRGK
jgi:hypothetical protein